MKKSIKMSLSLEKLKELKSTAQVVGGVCEAASQGGGSGGG